MRETRHYGIEFGAIEVENRANRRGGKAHVDKIILGVVRRFTAEEQAMGAPMLKFTPAREIHGGEVIAFGMMLDRARDIYRANPEAGLRARDDILRPAVSASLAQEG